MDDEKRDKNRQEKSVIHDPEDWARRLKEGEREEEEEEEDCYEKVSNEWKWRSSQ